ncbi:MAG TPA: hypothetical protein VIG64_04285 [Actinomycetota bacterium]
MTQQDADGIGREPRPVVESPATPVKRSRKAKLIEFSLWALLSIVTAVVMILLSNKLLPTNF